MTKKYMENQQYTKQILGRQVALKPCNYSLIKCYTFLLIHWAARLKKNKSKERLEWKSEDLTIQCYHQSYIQNWK